MGSYALLQCTILLHRKQACPYMHFRSYPEMAPEEIEQGPP